MTAVDPAARPVPAAAAPGADLAAAAELAAREVARLRATFASGATRPLGWRQAQLDGLLRLVTEREADIAGALAADLGRSPLESWLGDTAPVAGEARHARRHVRSWMRGQRARLPLAVQPGRARVVPEPLGVVLVVGPWNYPVHLVLAPLVAALAAGNCAVVKPSELAPASSALLADLLPQYVDGDAVAVVEGDAAVTQALIAQGLDHVFFTGGTAIGRRIAEAAAPLLTPVTLELGGKSPVVVTRHADLEVAARRVAFGKLLNSGQTCVAPDYVLVERPVRDRFVELLRAAISDFRAGQPAGQRVLSPRQLERLRGLLGSGEVVQGGVVDEAACALEPTVLLDPDRDSPVMAEEVFGPVLPVLTVDSLDDAIAEVRRGDKPLAAYLFSGSREEQQRFAADVPAGAVVVNHVATHLLAPTLPFGGIGASGQGAYHGRWGFEVFSHRKPVLVSRTRPDTPFLYPPHSRRDERLLRLLVR